MLKAVKSGYSCYKQLAIFEYPLIIIFSYVKLERILNSSFKLSKQRDLLESKKIRRKKVTLLGIFNSNT